MNKNDIKVLIENIAEDSFCEFSEPSINKITNKLYNLVKNFDGDDPYQIKEDLESINIQEKYTMDSWNDFVDELYNLALDYLDESDDSADNE